MNLGYEPRKRSGPQRPRSAGHAHFGRPEPEPPPTPREPHPENLVTVNRDQAGASGPTLRPHDGSKVMGMPHQKPNEQKPHTWREMRAEILKVGRLNEEAPKAHKRRLLAELYGHAER